MRAGSSSPNATVIPLIHRYQCLGAQRTNMPFSVMTSMSCDASRTEVQVSNGASGAAGWAVLAAPEASTAGGWGRRHRSRERNQSRTPTAPTLTAAR